MNEPDRTDPSDQALEWVLRHELQRPTASDEAAFQAWLAADQTHLHLYDDAVRTYTIANAARRALGPVAPSNVVTPFPTIAPPSVSAPPSALRSRRWLLGGAGALAASVALVALVPVLRGDVYRTDVGERRMVTLADGSTVHLNGATEIRVRFSDNARRIDLRDGQAMFEVAHDPARPFDVWARDRIVRAVGTSFDIDMQAQTVSVAVDDGVVAILPAESGGNVDTATLRLEKGFALSYAGGQAPGAARAISLDQIGAWRRDMLIFDDVPLETIVAALARRYPGRFAVANRRPSSRRFSGSIVLRERNQTVRDLGRMLSIQVQQRGDQFDFASVTKSGT